MNRRLSLALCFGFLFTGMIAESAVSAEMKLLLEETGCEYGWSFNGVASWGADWHKRARNEALEQIRKKVASMVNMKELETFTKSDLKQDIDTAFAKGKESAEIRIAASSDKKGEERSRWVNKNNYLIDISDVEIKPGTDWTKTRKNWKGERSWKASATMTYTIKIYGKE